MSKIPGLVRITEGCGNKLVFDIEDDKVDQFYAHFGLQAGDNEGFQKIVVESLERLIAMHKCGSEELPTR
jgi:hypothetical protein